MVHRERIEEKGDEHNAQIREDANGGEYAARHMQHVELLQRPQYVHDEIEPKRYDQSAKNVIFIFLQKTGRHLKKDVPGKNE